VYGNSRFNDKENADAYPIKYGIMGKIEQPEEGKENMRLFLVLARSLLLLLPNK
jgi:hypothetical protein